MDPSIALLQDEVVQHFISWQHKANLLICNVKNAAPYIPTAKPILFTYSRKKNTTVIADNWCNFVGRI